MSQIEGQAAEETIYIALEDQQALERLPELKYIPRKIWQDYINIHNPSLPVSANLGVMAYSRVSAEAFVAKVPPAWSNRVRDLAKKLNKMAVVIALNMSIRHPILATLEGDISRAHEQGNTLADLWLIITAFFAEGEQAASYFSLALEAAVMSGPNYRDMGTIKPWDLPENAPYSMAVRRLNIPAPAAFWKEAAWHKPRAAMGLILLLAADPEQMPLAMSVLSLTLSTPDPSLQRMETERSASLRTYYEYAKFEATTEGATNVFGVDLVDKGLRRFKEKGQGVVDDHISFGRMFVMGVCPGGVKIWQAGGVGFTESLKEQNQRLGPGLLLHEEAEQFMQDFDRLVAEKGQWNSKRRKWYQRCFGVNLKELEEEQQKKLLAEYEPWIQVHIVNDVERLNIAKFAWQ